MPDAPDPLQQAQSGDLRPQLNPHACVLLDPARADPRTIQPILIDRFLRLARPIADASRDEGPETRLQDAGPFFYLIEALRRFRYDPLHQTLCILLDEFCQLDTRSYDELYLWCLVELSRTDPRYVETYWPLVVGLDARWRAAPWKRPAGEHPVARPYRLTELLFYYYVLYTRNLPTHEGWDNPLLPVSSPYESLGSLLMRILPRLRPEEVDVVRWSLQTLRAVEKRRPVFRDALGLLARRRGPAPA